MHHSSNCCTNSRRRKQEMTRGCPLAPAKFCSELSVAREQLSQALDWGVRWELASQLISCPATASCLFILFSLVPHPIYSIIILFPPPVLLVSWAHCFPLFAISCSPIPLCFYEKKNLFVSSLVSVNIIWGNRCFCWCKMKRVFKNATYPNQRL